MAANTTNGTADGDDGYSLAAYIVIGIILYLIVILAIVGNVLVITSVLAFRKLRTVTNFFVISLAVSDLLLAVFVMDFNAIFVILGEYWPFGKTFCDIYIAIDICLSTASILNLCIISLDRYWAITSPFSYYQRVNAKNAIILICIAWVISFLISALPVILGIHQDHELSKSEFEQVYNNPEFCLLTLSKWYAVVSSTVSFFIPSLIIIYTYARIFIVARTQARQIAAYNNTGQRIQGTDQKCQGSMRRERRAAKTLAIIVGVFIWCWLPFFIVNVAGPFCKCIPKALSNSFVWLGYANSVLNPIIYAHNQGFRNAYKIILMCYRCRGISTRHVESSDDQIAMSTSRQERQRERLANGHNHVNPEHSNNIHKNPAAQSQDTSLVISNPINVIENPDREDDSNKSPPEICIATISHSDTNAEGNDALQYRL